MVSKSWYNEIHGFIHDKPSLGRENGRHIVMKFCTCLFSKVYVQQDAQDNYLSPNIRLPVVREKVGNDQVHTILVISWIESTVTIIFVLSIMQYVSCILTISQCEPCRLIV